MASGSSSSSKSNQDAGTLSPITASLWQMFTGQPNAVGIRGGAYVPTAFGSGGAFGPESFRALPGLLANQPLSDVESRVFGVGQVSGGPQRIPRFDQGAYEEAVNKSLWGMGINRGPFINPLDYMSYQDIDDGAGGAYGQNMSFADLAAGGALRGQGLLESGIPGIQAAMDPNPAAQIALARRGFERETLPQIREAISPANWNSSDFSKQLMDSGVDLETNIAALREGSLDRIIQGSQAIPGYVSALSGNLLDAGSNIAQFGQMGRDFVRGVSPAGDAQRVIQDLQALVGPALVSIGKSSSKGGSGSVLWG